MDLQKEREAFEAWFESRYDAHFMQFALDLDMYVDKHTQRSWEAWQAAKAIPNAFVVVNKKELAKVLNCVTDNWLIDTDSVEEFKKIESLVQDEIDEMFKAWEPANTENTIRCTNCGLEFESDYDLEQNLIDPETGEIHDGCPTCKTDAYLMDLIK